MADTTFTPFNLATMSGVFPGTRTQIFQRVRLQKIEDSAETGDTEIRWAQILWYENPPACVVVAKAQRAKEATSELLLRIEDETTANLHQRLIGELSANGWQLHSCVTCQHWQPTLTENLATQDGNLRLGRCSLTRQGDDLALPDVLATQSYLALDCPAWQLNDGSAKTRQESRPIAPLSKVAEVSESKLKPLQRLQRRIGRWLGAAPSQDFNDWRQKLMERSGVGAGTEPCFACQGRIANLGALAVESTAGDKQTFSVWRCRSCYSLYLSDWSDRWERLENLETEELIYRVAPAEAAELLSLILSVPGGEHPAQRAQRSHLRDWLLNFAVNRPLLSRQIKQGR